jgi:HPt (histidine-containing phosphotransfer) domain-containing protein
MTADTAEDSREKCLAAGMDDYISKPVQLSQLEGALVRAVHPSAAGGEAEILDPVVLAGLRLLRKPGRPDPVVELTKLFLKEAPDRLAIVEQAIAANDIWSMSKIVAAATSLKGSAGNLGARTLATICAQLEDAARAGDLEAAAQVRQRAVTELVRVRGALEKLTTPGSGT